MVNMMNVCCSDDLIGFIATNLFCSPEAVETKLSETKKEPPPDLLESSESEMSAVAEEKVGDGDDDSSLEQMLERAERLETEIKSVVSCRATSLMVSSLKNPVPGTIEMSLSDSLTESSSEGNDGGVDQSFETVSRLTIDSMLKDKTTSTSEERQILEEVAEENASPPETVAVHPRKAKTMEVETKEQDTEIETKDEEGEDLPIPSNGGKTNLPPDPHQEHKSVSSDEQTQVEEAIKASQEMEKALKATLEDTSTDNFRDDSSASSSVVNVEDQPCETELRVMSMQVEECGVSLAECCGCDGGNDSNNSLVGLSSASPKAGATLEEQVEEQASNSILERSSTSSVPTIPPNNKADVHSESPQLAQKLDAWDDDYVSVVSPRPESSHHSKSGGVKWEKMETVCCDDDDYASVKDYTPFKEHSMTDPVAGELTYSKKRADIRRRRKARRRRTALLLAFLVSAALLLWWHGLVTFSKRSKTEEETVDSSTVLIPNPSLKELFEELYPFAVKKVEKETSSDIMHKSVVLPEEIHEAFWIKFLTLPRSETSDDPDDEKLLHCQLPLLSRISPICKSQRTAGRPAPKRLLKVLEEILNE